MLHAVSVPPHAGHRCEFVLFYNNPPDGLARTFSRLDDCDWNKLSVPLHSDVVSYVIIPEVEHPCHNFTRKLGDAQLVCGLFSPLDESEPSPELLTCLASGFALPPEPSLMVSYLWGPVNSLDAAKRLRVYAYAASELYRDAKAKSDRALAQALGHA